MKMLELETLFMLVKIMYYRIIGVWIFEKWPMPYLKMCLRNSLTFRSKI